MDPLGSAAGCRFNSRGLLATVTNRNGNVTTLGRDAMMRMTSVTDAIGRTREFSYDGASRLTSATQPGGPAATYTRNNHGRLTAINDLRPDAEPDSNGDGIPNTWYLQYGLDPSDPNIASVDSDGDGLTNREEHLLGTNPIDASSTFQVLPNPETGNMTAAGDIASKADPSAPSTHRYYQIQLVQ